MVPTSSPLIILLCRKQIQPFAKGEILPEETSIPGKYEIPREVIAEAIVNAFAHRDYTHNGSVQLMLFKDRLEIRNPGSLPLGWTVEKLKEVHTSVPRNLLLAEPMYQAGYIERLGAGTSDMVTHAKEAGLVDPVFSQEDTFNVIIYRQGFGVTDQVPIKYRPSTDQADGNPHRDKEFDKSSDW